MNRRTGILLHITSLPSDFGIGDFGPSAYRHADYLHREGHSIWQILPLNHPGYGNSPYNPVSAFALNPYLISPELLYEQGLINRQTLDEARLPDSSTVFYESVYKTKDKLLTIAAANWLMNNSIDHLISGEAALLKPYLAFQTLSRIYGDTAWFKWQLEHRCYSPQLFDTLWHSYEPQMKLYAAYQAILKDQIGLFKDYLKKLSITLVGDIPLYLSYESAEVWAYPHFFDLDESGNRLHLAGVPPDAFAADGQLWGNPIYRWEAMKQDGFSLFMKRIGEALAVFDLIRLDHFIGYVNYWQVDCSYLSDGTPVLPPNAINGKWIPALPQDFFATLCRQFESHRFIAEDLGILNPEVCNIRDSFGFPGMIVLQFCFEESVPQVQHYPSDRWLYTGTHDNSTLQGWFDALTPDKLSVKHLQEYCNAYKPKNCSDLITKESIHLVMRRIALDSACGTVIMPLQDILGLDDNARMNVPGTALGNWQWRLDNKNWDYLTTFYP